jgi:hypothetical protein
MPIGRSTCWHEIDIREAEMKFDRDDNDMAEVSLRVRGDGLFSVLKVLRHFQYNGGIGHSYSVVLDDDNPDGRMTTGWDGDGADAIEELKVNGKELDTKQFDKDHMDMGNDRKAMAERVARDFLAKTRPDDEFAGAFYDIREKVKTLKDKWSEQAKVSLQNTLINDLKSRGVVIVDAKISLGKYRGSAFVTSAKLKVKLKSAEAADSLLIYLKGRYSPKYKLKKVTEGDGGVTAEYNVR